MSTSLPDRLARQFLGVVPGEAHAKGANPDYPAAFEEWTSILGREYVLHDDLCREAYSTTSLPVGTRPAGVVRPSTTEQVSQVARIARHHNVPLHAISCGKNWGYGDTCAAADGYVIVDLGRMNRIREVNAELGYAVIEPGVTQGQMYAYIQQHKLPLLFDVTGAGPDASITGSILQRGFGHTPYGDRFRHTCGFEVVLPDGEIVNTGFGQFENAKASRVFHWGVGPWVDGLFTQSAYGIVTGTCFWLMPMPECIEAFVFRVGDDKLGDVVDVIRRLRMSQTLRSTIHLANDLRVLSSRIRYPWERTGGATPLPDDVRLALRREHGLRAWNGLGALYGTHTEVKAARRVVARHFRGAARVFFVRRRRLVLAQKILRNLHSFAWARQLVALTENMESVLDLLEGIPNSSHVSGSFWRDRREDPKEAQDPRNSGLIWHSPVLPATGSHAKEFLKVIYPIFSEFGFDPLITMSSVSERSLCCVASINYDKQDPADGRRAAKCYSQLTTELAAIGYLPYRTLSVPVKDLGTARK